MPGGRPYGSKTSVDSKSFKAACKRTFFKLGDKWLEQTARDHPAEFLRVLASMEPRQIGFDDPTIQSLAALAQSMAGGK